jgi:hypothetical protein
MAMPKFPLDQPHSMGRFWVAGTDPEKDASDGLCRIEDGSIGLEVVTPLTSWMEWVGEGENAHLRRSNDEEDLVIHGALPIHPRYVTFFGTRTMTRYSNYLPSSSGVPELHGLAADWCIAGAHVEDPEFKFTAVRARFTHFEPWARTQTVMLKQRTKPPLETKIEFTPVQAPEFPFTAFDEDAKLLVSTIGQIGLPGPWGAHVKTYDWLKLEGLSGWTLEEALARFVRPVQVLLTFLAGERCAMTHLEVEVEGNWLAVYGDGITPDAPRPTDERLLLTSKTFPPELLSAWCAVTDKTSPTPHVVAASIGGDFASIEAEALALVTTAEALDRVFFPRSRRFSEEDVVESVTALSTSEVPEDVRDALSAALTLYLYEDTYPMRMGRLGEKVATAVPKCVGKPNKWKSEIVGLRVDLAHGLGQEKGSTDAAIWKMHARVQSLRWALMLRLLLEAGVEPAALTEATEDSGAFRSDERMWRRRLPKVFPAPPATTSTTHEA